MEKEVKMTPEKATEIYQLLLDAENSWDRLMTISSEIMDLADKLENVDKGTFENLKRQKTIRKKEEQILGGILDLQSEAWVMIANLFISAGQEPPECEAKRIHELYQARKAPTIAPRGAVVVELNETDLERGIKKGWL